MFCVTRNTVSQSQNQFYSIERPTYKEKETMKTRKMLSIILVIAIFAVSLTACANPWHWPWTQLDGGASAEKTNNEVVVDVNRTYIPELSCSDLISCPTSVVHEGTFTIGYKNTGSFTCDFFVFNAGETIDYKKIDEFHTYNGELPKTSMDGFARSQTSFVYACTH